jgi:homospermidine synthase
MWKQWRIEGGKEKGEENADNENETTLSKVDEKTKFKGKDHSKAVIFLARRQIRKYAKE